MSISRKDFENGNFKRRNNNRLTHPVTVFLRKASRNSRDFAFTLKEIAKVVKMKEESIRSMLRSLKQDGLVLHKQPYFAWKTQPSKKKR